MLNTDDVDRIRRATDELQQASYKLSEIMYQAAAAGQSATGGESPGAEAGAGEEGVIDAEFKEHES